MARQFSYGASIFDGASIFGMARMARMARRFSYGASIFDGASVFGMARMARMARQVLYGAFGASSFEYGAYGAKSVYGAYGAWARMWREKRVRILWRVGA